MAYNNNVPLSSQRIPSTQNPIRENFEQIDTLIDVDHISFNQAQSGKHKKVSLVAVTTPPAQANEGQLFFAENPTTSSNHIFIRRGTLSAVPITLAGTDGGNRRYRYLPSGLVVKYGSFSVNGDQAIDIDGGTFPAYDSISHVQLTVQGSGSIVVKLSSITNPSTLNVRVFNTTNGSAAAGTVYYETIGTLA